MTSLVSKATERTAPPVISLVSKVGISRAKAISPGRMDMEKTVRRATSHDSAITAMVRAAISSGNKVINPASRMAMATTASKVATATGSRVAISLVSRAATVTVSRVATATVSKAATATASRMVMETASRMVMETVSRMAMATVNRVDSVAVTIIIAIVVTTMRAPAMIRMLNTA